MLARRILLAFILALISLAPLARAEDIDLSTLQPDANIKTSKTDEGLQFTIGKAQTPKQYTTPLVITAVAKTDSNNIRIFFGKGMLILNWAHDNKAIRMTSPADGKIFHLGGDGSVPINKFVTVVWTIENDKISFSVDGEIRAIAKGDFSNIASQIGIGTLRDSNVVFKSLSIQSAKSTPAPANNSTPAPADYIDVSVPTGPHVDNPPPAPASADPDAIERPQFQNTAKPLIKNLASITSMMVTIDADGTEHGLTSDIIATVPYESRHANSSGIGFIINDGDDEMKIALQEAVRAINLRYPIWEAGHIDLSFGEKFVTHGGPSAGTAFGVLMLSILEGFSIDPKCAITGDITVDWKVRKIGGVVAKLHGATLDNCTCAAIPEDNASALPDLAILDGPSALWNIQIFSIATLQDAVAITRKDRDPKLAQAIKEFADLQTTLNADKSALKSAATQTALKHILTLAPNHASAKYLLAISEGTASRYLSPAAGFYQISTILYPYRVIFANLDRDSLADLGSITAISRKRIQTLRPLLGPDLSPLLTKLASLVETMDDVVNHGASVNSLQSSIDNLNVGYATFTTDKDQLEKIVRDGY